ncbi:homoserine dehydrogenase [bacterium]|nr:homoserine dehydrogenase [bacterium]
MRKVHVGFLGLGTVGQGAVRTLLENKEDIMMKTGAEIEIKKIAVKHLDKKRDVEIPPDLLTNDPYEVVNDSKIDIVVELIGGLEPARSLIKKALANGKNVVTANKEVIALYGGELLPYAAERKLDLYFEGAVGGGIPIVRPMKICLAGNRIYSVVGIVNATTNYILTKMAEEKLTYDEALKEAQEKGYAEADPTYDVEGLDAAYKIAILASIAFNSRVKVEEIYREGISKISPIDLIYAEELGYVIKLLAIAKQENDMLSIRVHPALIPKHHPLASVRGVNNAILVHGSSVGRVMFYGEGAGSLPTGSAVVGDIIDIARNMVFNCTGRISCTCFKQIPQKDISEITSKYYIRMKVKDQPGVLAAIAACFGEEKVSIASVVQKRQVNKSAEIVWITHPSNEGAMRRSLEKIEKLPVLEEISLVLRAEE